MGAIFNGRLVSVVRKWVVAGVISTAGVSVALVAGPAAADPSPHAPGGPGIYGDPAAAAEYWRPQTLDDDCGLMAVADVVGQTTGQLPSEQEMVDLAVNT